MDPSAVARAFVEAARPVIPPIMALDGGISACRPGAEAAAKADGSPVSAADVAAQVALAHGLRRRLGNIPIFGEENDASCRAAGAEAVARGVASMVGAGAVADPRALLVPAVGEPAPRTYVAVDPIDGTKGFLAGGQYALCLAWVERGRPRVGLVVCPRMDPNRPRSDVPRRSGRGVAFLAVDDRLEVAEVTADGELGPFAPPADATRGDDGPWIAMSRASGHTDPAVLDAISDALGTPVRALRLDGQGKYGLAAVGVVDAYVRVPRTPGRREPVWDHAAGHALARAAGLRVTDARGRPFDLSHPPYAGDGVGVVVAPPALHGPIVEATSRRLLRSGA